MTPTSLKTKQNRKLKAKQLAPKAQGSVRRPLVGNPQKQKNLSKKLGRLACTLECLTVLGLFAGLSAGFSSPKIGTSHVYELSELLRQSVERLVAKELKALSPQDPKLANTEVIANVQMTFDQSRLDADWQQHVANYEKKRQAAMEKWLGKKSPTNKDQDKPKTPKAAGGSETKFRFGSLNLDIDHESFEEALESITAIGGSPTANQGPGINLTIDSGEKLPPFSFDASDYLKSVQVDVLLPNGVPEDADAKLSAKLTQALKAFVAVEPQIAFARAPALPQVEPESMVAQFLSPQNPSIGLIASGLILGFFLLVGTLLITKGFSRIAVGLADLKPTESSQTGPAESAAEPEPAAAEPDTTGGQGEAGATGGDAAMQVLTSEMKTIRSQFQEIVSENHQIMAELLRDLYYEPSGLEGLRDLLSFAGYTPLRPALDLLPRNCLAELQVFIEDSRSEPVDLLSGVEIAQRLYRDCVSRMTSAENEHLDKLRQGLVLASDGSLQAVMEKGDPEEISLCLRALSVSRGNQVMKSLPSETLKSVTEWLDRDPDDMASRVEAIVKTLEETKDDSAAGPKNQLRFIMRLARSAGVADEDQVLALIGEDDWDIKRAVLAEKFMLAYVPFLPDDDLKDCVNRLPSRDRAEWLHCVDADLRNRVMAYYKEGSKLRDMLQNELDLIGNNAERAKAIENRKDAILQGFLQIVQQRSKSHPELVKNTLEFEAEKRGIAAPNWDEKVEAPPQAA